MLHENAAENKSVSGSDEDVTTIGTYLQNESQFTKLKKVVSIITDRNNKVD